MGSDIQFSKLSEEVQIRLGDGRVLIGPRGATVGEFLKALSDDGLPTIVGSIVNGELRELTYTIDREADVKPVRLGEPDGMRIYRRSLTFLLEAAFERLFPEATLTIDHSVFSGGYYCQVEGGERLSQEDLDEMESLMRQMVAEDLPFCREEVPLAEAIEFFKSKGMDDKVRLLAHRKKDYLVLYTFGEHRDYHHGYMVPSSSYIQWFKLNQVEDGFVLRFPRHHAPTEILPLGRNPKLIAMFRDYGKWLERLGISSVGSLNDAISEDRIREVILVSEALHERRVAHIASLIAERRADVRIVLIAGPSSSGKTTFSKRLSIQMLAHGLTPFPLELDNYFVDRDFTPRDENGEFDFEQLGALNLKQLNQDLKGLIAGEEVQLPKFDFISGKSVPGEIVQLEPGQLVILEGIHGLNPDLLPEIPDEQTFRVYCSALTQLNLDRHNRVSTTDTRLVRRIVRDARTRGYSPQDTIQRWESVRRGEKRYIFPYQENADVMFNSALAYELAVLKPLAEPLLRQVSYKEPEHVEVKRLLALLEWFLPLDSSLVPDNSLLLEFIGGSILKDFKLWKNGK
ncbi:MAG: nucleoside kinase [Anaerolineales bacterium]|nr:nucleoside kinase [Anaerolineales bacterium]